MIQQTHMFQEMMFKILIYVGFNSEILLHSLNVSTVCSRKSFIFSEDQSRDLLKPTWYLELDFMLHEKEYSQLKYKIVKYSRNTKFNSIVLAFKDFFKIKKEFYLSSFSFDDAKFIGSRINLKFLLSEKQYEELEEIEREVLKKLLEEDKQSSTDLC
jgi:hypothetical protein